jgi:hypothetical protein
VIRVTVAAKPRPLPTSARRAGQRIHTGDGDEREDERELDGSDDRGEAPQRQNTDQEPVPGELDDQSTRHQPARLSGSPRIGHTGNVSVGHYRRHHAD